MNEVTGFGEPKRAAHVGAEARVITGGVSDNASCMMAPRPVVGVPVEEAVEKSRALPSRMVLTNPGDGEGGAKLKARWCVGGHRDPDAGVFPTSSPTALLLEHHLLLFISEWEAATCGQS